MNVERLNLITYISLIIIVIAFFFCLFYVSRQRKTGALIAKRRWIEQLPSMISTLGVLGTFAGITIGLLYFDTEDLDASIPILLSGLKTAFFTSLAGMIGSLFLSRQVNSALDEKDGGMSDIDMAAGQICKAVDAMNTTTKEAFEELRNQNKQQLEAQLHFYRTISETVSSLTTNIGELKGFSKKFDNVDAVTTSINSFIGECLEITSGIAGAQNEISDEIKNFSMVLRSEVDEIEEKMKETNNLLVGKFDEFSELLKKSNTEALVDVMKSVTEEFQKQMNSLINKLIQENFDQLNKSVESLNVWQQENKEMISSLTKQYKEMTANFEQTSTTLTKVSGDTRLLVSDGGKLRQLIDALNQVIIEDQKFVKIVAQIEETATLSKDNMLQFEESTKSLNEWVRKQRNFVDGVQILIQKLEELNKLRDYNEQFWQNTKRSLEEGVGFITQGSRTLNTQLTALDKQFYARLSTTLAELDACIQAMIRKN
ncbi:hypothetical protein [Alistipes shahii]|jgi:hypothetical protein|nr:hypothetical protein [Alistipes shahii]MCI7594357.1 hypothetical protein [Alistipes shahii]MDY4930717.1 hypothetical protein [Alistipes shahii]